MIGHMHQDSYIIDFIILLPPIFYSYRALHDNISSSKELQDLNS